MLEFTAETEFLSTAPSIDIDGARVICDLTIPASQRHLLEGHGASSSYSGDERRHLRVRRRGWGVMQTRPSLPAIARAAESHAILVINMSRSGIGFLHSASLFPCERVRLMVGDHGCELEIKACRRLAAGCFLLGAERLEPDHSEAGAGMAFAEDGG